MGVFGAPRIIFLTGGEHPPPCITSFRPQVHGYKSHQRHVQLNYIELLLHAQVDLLF